MDARGIGDAQAGAEVARIGDTVEHEQESRFLERVEDVVEMRHLAPALDAGDDPLMPRPRRHAIEAPAVAGNDPDPLQLGMREQIAGARIVARGIDEDFLDGVGIVPKLGGDGVKAVDQA